MTEICDRVLKARRPGAAVRAARRAIAMPGARQPLRHAAARGARHGRRTSVEALREVGKLLAFLKEPEPPQGLEGRVGTSGRCSSRCSTWRRRSVERRRARRSCGKATTSISRGCRCRPAGRATPGRSSPGACRHARAAQEAPEPRHLPPAGDRAQQGDHALARASRRRARFPRSRAGASGRAVSGRGRARRRSGDDARRGDAGAGHAVRIPVRRPAARRAHRARASASARPAGAGDAPRSCSKAHPARCGDPTGYETALEGPFGDHTGYYNEQRALSGVHDRAHHDAPRSDLPLHLHRQAARRAGGARAWR